MKLEKLKVKQFKKIYAFVIVIFASQQLTAEVISHADRSRSTKQDTGSITASSTVPSDSVQAIVKEQPKVQPLTPAEIRNELKKIQQKTNASIEIWSETIKPEDLDRTWYGGRQLNRKKRQEVCAIYQIIVNDTYKLALENKARLSADDQIKVLDRNSFIQSLGFKNNIVRTQLGFDCLMV